MKDLDGFGRGKGIFTHVLLFVGAFVVAAPFVWMIFTSLKGSTEVLKATNLLPALKYYHEYDDPLLGERCKARVKLLETDRPDGRIRFVYASGTFRGEEKLVPAAEVIPQRFLWENYRTAWNALDPSFTIYFWNSFWVALLTTLGTLITASLAAYAFAFFRFPGRDILFGAFLITMMVPQQVLLIPDFLILRSLGWYDTYPALIVPFVAGAFGVFLLRQFFLSIPRDLFDAAQIDGCTRFGFLWRILLPLSGPALVTLGIFTFLASWNALLWPLIVTDDPSMRVIQVALNVFQQAEGTSWELLMAASTMTILPLVIGYFLAQRQFVQSIAGTGLKG